MSEVLTVHVGQAGVAAAEPLWYLYCLEHGLNIDGTVQYTSSAEPRGQGFNSFYTETPGGASPRALLVDLDPSTIDSLLNTNKKLFCRENSVYSIEDSGSNYAKARYGYYGKKSASATMAKLRKMAEASSSLQGFVIQHALGGGTGSGLMSNILDMIYYSFPKKPVLQFAIFPSSKMSVSVVEPYNTILGIAGMKAGHKCCCLSTNKAMFTALDRNDIDLKPNYSALNDLWDYAIGTVTANMRHGGYLTAKLSDLLTNLVPHPSLRFPFLSYSPMKPVENGSIEVLKNCFEPTSQLLSCDIRQGVYMSASIMMRGDLSPLDVCTMSNLRTPDYLNFAPWSSNGLKISLCPKPSAGIPNANMIPSRISACCINAHTSISQNWRQIYKNYRKLLSRKAYIHWYLSEGMEQDEFKTADSKILSLLDDYKNAET